MNAKSLLALVGLSLALAGCNDGGGSGGSTSGSAAVAPVTVTMPALSQGAHALLLAGDSDGSSADAFIGPSGHGFVLVAPDSEQAAAAVYQRSAGSSNWLRTPVGAGSVTLVSQADQLLADLPTPTPASLAGTFQAVFSGADSGGFQISPSGQISAASGAECQQSGSVQSSADYGGALGVSLNFSGCGQLSGAYNGIVFVDQNAPNAAFRIVAANAMAVLDFYAYPR